MGDFIFRECNKQKDMAEIRPVWNRLILDRLDVDKRWSFALIFG